MTSVWSKFRSQQDNGTGIIGKVNIKYYDVKFYPSRTPSAKRVIRGDDTYEHVEYFGGGITK